MATIKTYSDLQQSKKLAEILPIESADMTYLAITEGMRDKMSIKGWEVNVGLNVAIKENLFSYRNGYMFPCWSLAALLDLLPEIQGGKPTIELDDNYITYPHMSDLHTKADNLVDACYEMIIRLNELKIL